MALGAYQAESTRGSVLNALAHPTVVNPVAAISAGVNAARDVTSLRQEQFNLQQAQLQPTYAAMRMLAATNPDPTEEQFMTALGGAARNQGNIDSTVANYTDWKAQNPNGKPGDFLRGVMLGGMSPEAQYSQTGQQFQARQTAQGTYYGTVGGPATPNANVFTPTGFVAQGLTPGEATELVDVKDPKTGQIYKVPKGVLYGTGVPGGGAVGSGATPTVPSGAYGSGGPNNAKVPDEYMPYFQAASARTGIPVDVLIAQARQESSFNPNATGAAGEIGIGQIKPATAQNPGFGMQPVDPKLLRDPQTNINFMADYLKAHLPAGANPADPAAIRLALQGYNGGGDPNYVANVTRYLPVATAAASGGAGGGAGTGGAPASGPFVGATTAQPVGAGGGAVQPAGAGGVQYIPASPGGGGGGIQLPGVTRTPGGPVLTEPPAGFGERLRLDQEGYSNDQRALPTRYTNVQNLNTALEALKLTDMGRSTGAVHNFYSFLSSQGVAPNFVDNNVAQYDIARKAMMAFAASRIGTGNTDLARVQSELSNASPEISPAASMHVLKQNLGLERMEIAANQAQQDKTGAGYGANKAQFYRDNDPRAFAWDAYTPEERATIQADAAKTKGGLDKLRASLRRGIDLGLVAVPSAAQ